MYTDTHTHTHTHTLFCAVVGLPRQCRQDDGMAGSLCISRFPRGRGRGREKAADKSILLPTPTPLSVWQAVSQLVGLISTFPRLAEEAGALSVRGAVIGQGSAAVRLQVWWADFHCITLRCTIPSSPTAAEAVSSGHGAPACTGTFSPCGGSASLALPHYQRNLYSLSASSSLSDVKLKPEGSGRFCRNDRVLSV